MYMSQYNYIILFIIILHYHFIAFILLYLLFTSHIILLHFS
jgi:hypothetical protein